MSRRDEKYIGQEYEEMRNFNSQQMSKGFFFVNKNDSKTNTYIKKESEKFLTRKNELKRDREFVHKKSVRQEIRGE